MPKKGQQNVQSSKIFHPIYFILRIQRIEGSVDLDEMAYYELPHLDHSCLLVLRMLVRVTHRMLVTHAHYSSGTLHADQ